MNTTQRKAQNKTGDTLNVEQSFPVVGIGASAGGLDALKRLLESLSQSTGLAFVIIQHLATNQESMLPEILSRATKMPVHKVNSGMQIEPNNVYVIPSGAIMTIKENSLRLHPRLASLKPIDEFLYSLASEQKTVSIGIILSGTGNDGTEGLKHIKAEGGITFAQDPKTAQYEDMPKNAIAAQVVDFILSPEQISENIESIVIHPELKRQKIEVVNPQETQEFDLQTIFGLLKASSGVNFANYKRNTILRRITRRMLLNKIETTKKYTKFLKENPGERQALFDDLLINVTGFFREPDTFAIIQEKVLPNLIKQLKPNNLLRVWVPGCATGEEAYSVTIALTECLQDNRKINIQIFGTDVNAKNIEIARKGIYLKAIEDRVSGSQLEKYFLKANGNYQITKSIRDKCVFAKHDITQDPPFSNLDLIVCRNLLIYIDSLFQEKILPLFNYALNPDGYLVLGESESIGKFTNMFEPIEKRGPVFRKKSGQSRIELPTQSSPSYLLERPIIKAQKASVPTLKDEVDQLLLNQYVPATVLVDNNADILVFRGQVNPFISIEPGTPSFSVSKIIRKDLRPTIQTAIYRAKKSKKDIQETVRFEYENDYRTVNIHVKYLKLSKEEEPYFLIFLDEQVKSKLEEQEKKKQNEGVSDRTKDQQQIKELSEDLETTKQTLQTVIEQQEATNEELRSANEEVQSSNEELMSTNEELETSKEELQSTNEELNTLNDELKNRNQNLSHLNDDLNNLMNNVDTAVIIVDNEFKIKRFTASAQELLRLTPSDINHPITELRLGIPVDDLHEPLSMVISKLTVVRQEINTGRGQWFQMRIRPYITEDKKIGGAVISLANITEMKKWENQKKIYSDNLETQVKEQTAQVLRSENLAAIGKTAAMVGHDIRNPLQSMIGELYLMTSEVTSLSDGAEKRNLQESILSLNQNLAYINKIVADLQDFAKTPTIAIEEVKIDKVFQDVLSSAALPKEVVASILVDKDFPKLKLDSAALKRILANLVSNAVQAMPSGGKILVSAFYQQNKTLITVEDTGEGIPEEVKGKIFAPMFTTKAKGQGFGLAVVKKITEAMGGTVTFESEKGKGTKFILTFPIVSQMK